jgi:hypothetical protein
MGVGNNSIVMEKKQLVLLSDLLAQFASEYHGYGSEPALGIAAELVQNELSA